MNPHTVSSSQGWVDCETGNPTKIVFVSGHSYETLFTPTCSPAENKRKHVGVQERHSIFLHRLQHLRPQSSGSPVLHQPIVLSLGCAITHHQDGVIDEPRVADGDVVDTWKMQRFQAAVCDIIPTTRCRRSAPKRKPPLLSRTESP